MNLVQIISLLGIPLSEVRLIKVVTLIHGGYLTLVTLKNGLVYKSNGDGTVELVGVSSDGQQSLL